MRGNKYNFIYDDTPEKRKFVDNWCKLGLEAGNVVTIGNAMVLTLRPNCWEKIRVLP